MKPFSIVLILFALTAGSQPAFSQCPTDIIKKGRELAEKAAYQSMKKISPNTGHSPDWSLIDCTYDALNGFIVFKAELTWHAKTQMYFGDSGICKVWAELKLSDEDVSNTKIVIKDMTPFTKVCVDSRKWDALEGLINAAMNSSGGGY